MTFNRVAGFGSYDQTPIAPDAMWRGCGEAGKANLSAFNLLQPIR